MDGQASYDRDGSIASYSWIQTTGPTVTITGASTATPTFTAPPVNADTTLTFSLTVTDNEGMTSASADTVNVLVKNVNQLPIASAIVSPSSTVNKDTLVTLDGSKSSDPDGSTIASYTWIQTAGSPALTLSGANTAQATFTAPSLAADTTFTFQLTVTDSDGASSLPASVNVVVLKDTSVPPAPTTQPRTMGYWKLHEKETTALLPIIIDTNYNVNTWSKALNIFNKATAKNAYDMLAGQLLAAKLNVKNGVATCAIINDAIIQADSMLTNAAYKGPGSTKAPTGTMKTAVIDLSTKLDNYNRYGCSAFDSKPPAVVATTP